MRRPLFLLYHPRVNRTALSLILIAFISTTLVLQAQSSRKRLQAKSAEVAPTAAPEIPSNYRDLLADSSQALVVTTSGWDSVDGSLQRYEKLDGKWSPVGEKIPIVVGKNGLAWDGITDAKPTQAPQQKKEGDGRSPAGVFSLGEAFGFATSEPTLKLPYRPLTDSIECVDDPSSIQYNQVVDRKQIGTPDWNSSEKMRTIDAYKEGMVVSYNPDHLPGAGSCIFLHIWSGRGHGTAGCTAMPEDKLQEVLNWLDQSKKPVLVQFPAEMYKRIKDSWKLP